MYRFLRCFLCLLVVCCLILNLSPIKADAMSGGLLAPLVSGAAVTVSAPVAIAAGLIALGIMAGTNDDFQRVVGNAVDSLADRIKDGTLELIQTVDELGKKTYYMAADMMEDLHKFSFASEIVHEPLFVSSQSFTFANTSYSVSSDLPFSLICAWCSNNNASCYVYAYTYGLGSGSFTVNGNNVNCCASVGEYNFYCVAGWSGATFWNPPVTSVRVVKVPGYSHSQQANNLVGNSFVNSAYTDLDLNIGVLASSSTNFIDGTSAREWSEEYTNRGLYVDIGPDGDGNDEEGKWYWPIVLAGAGGAGVDTLTQADQWTTTTPDTFEEYETEEEYEVVGTPVVPFGSSVQLKPVTVPGVGDDTETDSGTTDDSADYTSWFDKIVGFLQNICESIKELPSKFASWFEAIIDGIQALPGKFATWFETIIDGIQAIPDVISGWFTDVIEWLTSIWEAICSIPTLILDGITAIFVPSEDFVTTKVEALRERFSWIEPILGYGDYIKAQFIDPVPPVVYVHLGDAEGSYNYGGTVKFLDMSWYERYKSQGDAIISGFLWALFAWRMYVKLPGIINGVAGDVGHISYGESAWQKAEARKERKEKGGKNK